MDLRVNITHIQLSALSQSKDYVAILVLSAGSRRKKAAVSATEMTLSLIIINK